MEQHLAPLARFDSIEGCWDVNSPLPKRLQVKLESMDQVFHLTSHLWDMNLAFEYSTYNNGDRVIITITDFEFLPL
jgi:hypothetical protein